MVHGTCSSRGCFAMTDENIAEIYAIAREAFAGGQRGFQFQSYPFRMTAENLAKHRLDPNIAFWKNLKEGSDTFEVTEGGAAGRGRPRALRVQPETTRLRRRAEAARGRAGGGRAGLQGREADQARLP